MSIQMPIQIRKLDAAAADFQQQLTAVLAFDAGTDDAIDRAAAEILADVKARGDAAVLDYTRRFGQLDAASMSALEIHQDELQAALAALPAARRDLLRTAADRVGIGRGENFGRHLRPDRLEDFQFPALRQTA